jgi:hypothetical protein
MGEHRIGHGPSGEKSGGRFDAKHGKNVKRQPLRPEDREQQVNKEHQALSQATHWHFVSLYRPVQASKDQGNIEFPRFFSFQGSLFGDLISGFSLS